MGGGNDTFTQGNNLLNSFVSLDGTTLANDGNDTFLTGGQIIINSEIVGRGGNDTIATAATGLFLNGSTVNGNTGDDTIFMGGSASSFVYGGQGTDTIATNAGAANSSSSVLINGNKGSDSITLGASGFASGSVYGGNGNDTITAAAVTTAAAAVLQTTDAGVFLSGDLGDDNITGSNGVDTIEGGDGNDVLGGGTGIDGISGGAGNDNITGGAAGDNIAGGAGNDVFITANGSSVLTAAAPSVGFDSITDFVANTGTTAANTINGDRIQFSTAVNATILGVGSVVSGGVSLLADLSAGITYGAANQVATITITGPVAWAGNYVTYETSGAAAAFDVSDEVIKVNTLAGIVANTFNG